MEKSKRTFNKKSAKKRTPLAYIPRYPYLPLVNRVRLRSRTYETGASLSAPVWNRYGILEPLNIDPMFQTELFSLYKRARIHSSTITVKLHNMGSEPIELIVAALPFSYVSGTPTIAEVVDKPGSRRVTVSGAGGMDRASLTKAVSSKQLLGHEWGLSDYDFDLTQANNTSPIATDEPTWYVALTSFNASTAISFRIEVVIEYDYEFYDQDTTV